MFFKPQSNTERVAGGSNKRPVSRVVAGVLLSLATLAAHASDFPNRPVTLISPFLPGGSGDTIARAIAEVASDELGQPVVVESKPGADALIGVMQGLKAAPDGYRVLWAGAGSLMVNPALRKDPPFDPVTAFTPLATAIDFSFFMYVHPSLPVNNMKEFIEYVKANPGEVSYATGNNQGLLIMADIAEQNGLDMVRVPYKGEMGAATDLVTNRVQAIFATSSLMNFAKEGKLKLLATNMEKRSPLVPEVPTLREEGIKGGEFGGGWLGVFGPAGLPERQTERLSKAFFAAFEHPSVQARLMDAGLVFTPYKSQEAMAQHVKKERDLYRETVVRLDMVQD